MGGVSRSREYKGPLFELVEDNGQVLVAAELFAAPHGVPSEICWAGARTVVILHQKHIRRNLKSIKRLKGR